MNNVIITIISGLAGALICGLIVYISCSKKSGRLREENNNLKLTLEHEKRSHEDKLKTLTESKEQLTHTFNSLSIQALKTNSEEFLKLAEQNLKRHQSSAEDKLSEREKAIEHLIKPIKEALDKTEKQITDIEKDRKEAYGSLREHLQSMSLAQQDLHDQTRQLVTALRRPEVRGQWGELTLKRLAELAGMVEHCDFIEQETVITEDGMQRPDMIIRMPNRRDIIVDVKTPLDAYLSAIEASDEDEQKIHLQRHAKNVKNRIQELSSKSYWSQFKDSPDFVVLFIPGDQFLSAALDQNHSLLEEALRQNVILATPTSFVALLRAIAFGWRQEQLAENAEKVRIAGETLYQRLNTFSTHLQKVGRSLESSLKSYNSAVGSFDSRVLPGARKFTELGIESGKEIEKPQQIETAVKQVETETIDNTETEA